MKKNNVVTIESFKKGRSAHQKSADFYKVFDSLSMALQKVESFVDENGLAQVRSNDIEMTKLAGTVETELSLLEEYVARLKNAVKVVDGSAKIIPFPVKEEKAA
jgi:archaellum component FlaC